MAKGRDRGRHHLRLEVAVLAILAMLVIDALDSFRLSSLADERGSALTGRMLSEFYGAPGTAGRDSIAIALITPQTLDAWDTGPPVPYGRQADMILRLLSAEPAAIFFDFLYSHPRETEADRAYLGFALQAAADAGVPVFFGPVGDRPGLEALRPAGQVDLGFQAEHANQYPVRGANNLPTAAAALYGALCAKGAAPCDPGLAQRVAAGTAPALAVQWSARSPRDLTRFWAPNETARCPFDAEGAGERARATLDLVLREATWGLRRTGADILQSGACFPHLAAPAHILLDMQDEAALAAFARGRAVLIGAAYPGSADVTLAPGWGRLPGVFQHAMALDNLLTLKGAYRRWPPELFYQLGLDDLLEAGLSMLLLAFGSWSIHRLVAAVREAPAGIDWRGRVAGPTAWFYAFLACAIGAPLAAGAAAEHWLHWQPANAIGVSVAVLGVGSIVVRRDIIGEFEEIGLIQPLIAGACALVLVTGLALFFASGLAAGQGILLRGALLLGGVAGGVALAAIVARRMVRFAGEEQR